VSDQPSDDFALADEFALASRQTPVHRIVVEAIDAAGGRITFATFMALALGHPEHGYYSRAGLRWGADGDYETSPEVHPIFGYLWARQVLECWDRLERPDPLHLVEVGAGSGAFSSAMLTWLSTRARDCFAALRPVVLDGHPRRVEEQRAALEALGFRAEHALTDEWLARDEPVTGVVISNEFFDALPAHLVERRGDALIECYVTHEDGELRLVTGEPSTDAIAGYFDRLGLLPGDGARAEVGLAGAEAMRRIAARLSRGYIITIDYGYEAAELYAPWRTAGTLMAFRRHSPQPDPLAEPGLTDLTYHVDFTSLAAAAGEGWEAAPTTSQAEALTVLGLAEAMQAASQRASADVNRYVSDRRAAEVLTDPTGLGRIRVLVLGRGAGVEGLRCLQSIEGLAAPR
jgi:SAM-dependent MidA family methyltransferase